MGADTTPARAGSGEVIQATMRTAGTGLPKGLRIVTLAEHPELGERLEAMSRSAWPAFVWRDEEAERYWRHLHEDFAAYQLMTLDHDGAIVALARSAPLQWNGATAGLPQGWGAQLAQSVADLAWGERPDTLGSLMVVVDSRRRGQRLGGAMIAALRACAVIHGYSALIACARPTQKGRYPQMSIRDYAHWLRRDGLPVDPWLRLHVRLGGRIVRAAARSMVIRGSVEEWSAWTGLDFGSSGEHVVPGAGSTVSIDLERGEGVEREPGVWIVHELAGFDVSGRR